jgi:octaprenyl-diphosphate synthase
LTETLRGRGTTARKAFSLISGRLRDVRRMYRENLATPVSIVREIGEYVAAGEGKMVRPALHLLCARMCAYRGGNDVLMATVLEFIHSATLIHDDIIDEATTRRGRPSVSHAWGNDVTVLFGDYMLAKAMEMALRVRSLEIMNKLAEVTLRMSEGEMLQTRYVGRIDLTVEEHLDLVERKTAALFSCCCETAGILAEVDGERLAALRNYGRDLGMAFQLVDDLLDLTGDEETLGKPTASDLGEGKVTLALIDLLREKPVPARALVERIMEAGGPGTAEIAGLTTLLRETGALERTRERAAEYAAGAARQLDLFEDSRARSVLQALPGELLVRTR